MKSESIWIHLVGVSIALVTNLPDSTSSFPRTPSSLNRSGSPSVPSASRALISKKNEKTKNAEPGISIGKPEIKKGKDDRKEGHYRNFADDGFRHRVTLFIPVDDTQPWNVWVKRSGNKNKVEWVFPGGGLERTKEDPSLARDDTYEISAYRECLEETGLAAEPEAPIAFMANMNEKHVTLLVQMKNAKVATKQQMKGIVYEERGMKPYNVFLSPEKCNIKKQYEWDYIKQYRQFLRNKYIEKPKDVENVVGNVENVVNNVENKADNVKKEEARREKEEARKKEEIRKQLNELLINEEETNAPNLAHPMVNWSLKSAFSKCPFVYPADYTKFLRSSSVNKWVGPGHPPADLQYQPDYTKPGTELAMFRRNLHGTPSRQELEQKDAQKKINRAGPSDQQIKDIASNLKNQGTRGAVGSDIKNRFQGTPTRPDREKTTAQTQSGASRQERGKSSRT